MRSLLRIILFRLLGCLRSRSSTLSTDGMYSSSNLWNRGLPNAARFTICSKIICNLTTERTHPFSVNRTLCSSSRLRSRSNVFNTGGRPARFPDRPFRNLYCAGGRRNPTSDGPVRFSSPKGSSSDFKARWCVLDALRYLAREARRLRPEGPIVPCGSLCLPQVADHRVGGSARLVQNGSRSSSSSNSRIDW